jgi:WS/DGAT/MGAT family acyltransferase
MPRLTPNDAMFLFGETKETMMHVASLLPFSPPPDVHPNFLRELLEDIRASVKLEPPWNLKLKHPGWLRHPFPEWVEDPAPDIDYHVRRSALPSPGGERELGVLVSRLHANPIDFSRPPWEAHLIEGLKGGRFALYTKMHHSLIDGFTGNKILARSFSTDPSERTPLFFNLGRPRRSRDREPQSALGSALDAVKGQLVGTRQVASTLRGLVAGLRGKNDLVDWLRAPDSILNGRIGRNRRFATQQYDLEHLKSLARASGGTLNDLVLALCGAALRRYLLEQGALPREPLVAMLPVAVRSADDQGGGNAVGAILASLATDVEDPRKRLDAIVASTTQAKRRLSGLSKQAVIQLSALTMAPTGLQAVTGTLGRVRPQFNVVISNVPGPPHSLYFRGAYLEAVYPLSIPIHGQALNITCTSYDGKLCFGFTGCRDSLPSLQNLAVYTGEALAELTEVLKP